MTVVPDGRVHALYAVHLLLRALSHRALQDVALPRPLSYEVRLAKEADMKPFSAYAVERRCPGGVTRAPHWTFGHLWLLGAFPYLP